MRKEDYQAAIDAQGACNLSAVVFSFAEIMQRICDQARRHGKGTDWINRHPISRLFAEQIKYLSEPTMYHVAFKECDEKSKQEEKDDQ